MPEMLQEYWIFILIALVFAFLLIFWLVTSSRRTKIERDGTALTDTTAKRNQALIDAPSASAGPVSVAANKDRVAAAPASADAEAGASVAPVEAPSAPETASPEAPGGADDLQRIKGLGPKLVTLLAQEGVTTFAQIAAWEDADIDRIDAKLGRFQGRIRRDNWVEQARFLAADDLEGYKAQFGNL